MSMAVNKYAEFRPAMHLGLAQMFTVMDNLFMTGACTPAMTSGNAALPPVVTWTPHGP